MPSGQSKRIWEIVGGSDKGGILVREGKDLSSAQLPARLGTGAHVEEMELISGRLHFRKVMGAGPQEGWISITVGDKVLARLFVPEAVSITTKAASIDSKLPTAAAQTKNPSPASERSQPKTRASNSYTGPKLVSNSYNTARVASGTETSWNGHHDPLLGNWQVSPMWTHDEIKTEQYESTLAGTHVLEDRAENFCLDNGVLSCVALPREALEWDDRECEMWFRTHGEFHPRDTVGLGRQKKPASEHHLPRSVPGRVSVIAPTIELRHQHHEILWLCFEAQDWPDKELVVVESYWSNPSPFFAQLAQEDTRIVYVGFQLTGEVDISIGVKRNVAVHVSTGEYIAHFDDDDLYAHNYLSFMIADLKSDKKAYAAKLSTWYLANLSAKFIKGNILVDPSFAICDPLRLHDTENGRARHSSNTKSKLYGFGFSFVYYRSVALDMPFADMSGGEDYKFYSQILDDKGPRSIDLVDDERGICLHIQHASNLTDCSICKYRDVNLADLFKLDIAKTSGFNIYMNLAGYGEQPLSSDLIASTAVLLGLQFQTLQVDGEWCMLGPDSVVYDLNSREPLGVLNHDTQQVEPYTDDDKAQAATARDPTALIMPEISVSDLEEPGNQMDEIYVSRMSKPGGTPERIRQSTENRTNGAMYDLDLDDDADIPGGDVDNQHGSVDVWDLD